MHALARDFIEKAVADMGPFRGHVLEIGSQDVNGEVKDLFPQATYVGIDIMGGPNVDIVIDAADWVPDRTYDCVVCTETFEHTARWREILAVIAQALAPKGLALITCATNPRKPHSASVDGGRVKYDEHYANVSRHEFIQAATVVGLKSEVTIDFEHGDLYAICRLDKRS